jgi:glycosyltransferase involved in cell wall biosynthesis
MVSVIIPIFNSSNFLRDSIQSILDQSYPDLELILIDDGSTDNSTEIIRSFTDPRIKFISLGENMGIFYALNMGLEISRGNFIIRMDADDISFPDRIQRQVQFMKNNPKVGVSGSLAEYFDGTPFNKAVRNDYLKPSLLLDCPFVHPTIIIRKEILELNNLRFSGFLEDYELWIKLSAKTDFGLLPEVLLKYRRSENQFTARNFDKRTIEANKLRIDFAETWLKRVLTDQERLVVSQGISSENQQSLALVESLCNELLETDPWGSKKASNEVVKKLFFRNFYRAPKKLKDDFTLFNCRFLSFREKINLAWKTSL